MLFRLLLLPFLRERQCKAGNRSNLFTGLRRSWTSCCDGRPPFSKAAWGYEVGRTGSTWPLVREYMHANTVRHVALEVATKGAEECTSQQELHEAATLEGTKTDMGLMVAV
jgi:hypothetical protein